MSTYNLFLAQSSPSEGAAWRCDFCARDARVSVLSQGKVDCTGLSGKECFEESSHFATRQGASLFFFMGIVESDGASTKERKPAPAAPKNLGPK